MNMSRCQDTRHREIAQGVDQDQAVGANHYLFLRPSSHPISAFWSLLGPILLVGHTWVIEHGGV